jgi:hypothetical protein
MPDPSLNDAVRDWGVANGGITSYDPAKYELTDGYTQEGVSVYAGATDWNTGLYYLTQGAPVEDFLGLENDVDNLVTEGLDDLILE